MQIQSLSQKDPLKEGMATHSCTLPWEIPWTEEPGGATVHTVAKSQKRLSTSGGKAARQQCAWCTVTGMRNIDCVKLLTLGGCCLLENQVLPKMYSPSLYELTFTMGMIQC